MTNQIVIIQESSNDYNEVFELNKIAFKQDGESKLIDNLRKNDNVFVPELSLLQ